MFYPGLDQDLTGRSIEGQQSHSVDHEVVEHVARHVEVESTLFSGPDRAQELLADPIHQTRRHLGCRQSLFPRPGHPVGEVVFREVAANPFVGEQQETQKTPAIKEDPKRISRNMVSMLRQRRTKIGQRPLLLATQPVAAAPPEGRGNPLESVEQIGVGPIEKSPAMLCRHGSVGHPGPTFATWPTPSLDHRDVAVFDELEGSAQSCDTRTNDQDPRTVGGLGHIDERNRISQASKLGSTMKFGQTENPSQYDVVVVGSGIAGSAAALTLARSGFRVAVIERRSHPRFAIGESMVPTTTHAFALLAKKYRVPELDQLFRYPDLRDLGCHGWPKRHFWFGVHREGEELDQGGESVFDTFRPPNGPDVHLLRSEADAFLVSLLPRYGVDYFEQTEVLELEQREETNRLRLRDPQSELVFESRLIVDASGHASFFAHELGLRESKTRLVTNTRTLFAHFTGVRDLDSILEAGNFNYRRDGGTMHHCFEGGWIWVIPFDNETCSVGAVLDRSKFPLERSPGETPDGGIEPIEELRRLFAGYPTVESHLGAAKPLFPPIRTDRIQFSSKTILSDGVILTPHAAGFVDPLFSSGFLLTAAFLLRFLPLACDFLKKRLSPRQTADFFAPLDECYQSELDQVDRLVSGTIATFRSPPLFRQYWRLWVGSTYRQFVGRVAGDPSSCKPESLLYGAGSQVWREISIEAQQLALAQQDAETTALALKQLFDTTLRADSLDWPLESKATILVDPYRSRSLLRFSAALRQELPGLKTRRFLGHHWTTRMRSLRSFSKSMPLTGGGGRYRAGVQLVRSMKAASK